MSLHKTKMQNRDIVMSKTKERILPLFVDIFILMPRVYATFMHKMQPKTWPRGYKTFFMLNSAEHENYPAHKC